MLHLFCALTLSSTKSTTGAAMDAIRSALSIVPSGTAATIIVGHALLTKLMMTVMFRLKLTMKSTPKAECQKILKSTFYQRVWSGAEPTFAVDAAPARRPRSTRLTG